jgi:myo-inositol-1(or 4)-monophosphatase
MIGVDPQAWLPELVAEIRRLGDFQLAGGRALRPDDIRWKQEPNGESSVVTRFDTESETRLREFLGRAFPTHSVLGEEQGDDRRDAEHYWLVDPIDGTSNFVDGIPYWGTSLAYWHAGLMRLGIVSFPALGHVFTAALGHGATWDGRPLRTPPVREYSFRGSVALESRSHLRHSLQLRTRVRILGSAVANLCLTATGAFQACTVRARLWDVAAGDLVLREARAVVETQPDLRGLDPARYAAAAAPPPRITLFARACEELPPLERFLRPVRGNAGSFEA